MQIPCRFSAEQIHKGKNLDLLINTLQQIMVKHTESNLFTDNSFRSKDVNKSKQIKPSWKTLRKSIKIEKSHSLTKGVTKIVKQNQTLPLEKQTQHEISSQSDEKLIQSTLGKTRNESIDSASEIQIVENLRDVIGSSATQKTVNNVLQDDKNVSENTTQKSENDNTLLILESTSSTTHESVQKTPKKKRAATIVDQSQDSLEDLINQAKNTNDKSNLQAIAGMIQKLCKNGSC